MSFIRQVPNQRQRSPQTEAGDLLLERKGQKAIFFFLTVPLNAQCSGKLTN